MNTTFTTISVVNSYQNKKYLGVVLIMFGLILIYFIDFQILKNLQGIGENFEYPIILILYGMYKYIPSRKAVNKIKGNYIKFRDKKLIYNSKDKVFEFDEYNLPKIINIRDKVIDIITKENELIKIDLNDYSNDKEVKQIIINAFTAYKELIY